MLEAPPPSLPPLSLYIHLPWCIKKCPYCDFNSYTLQGTLPEEAYIKALLTDLSLEKERVQNRKLHSIFFGGGTPSLISPSSIHSILNAVFKDFSFEAEIEITLEANPGTFERHPFNEYAIAGVNRLSLGIQSFQDKYLAALGRVHQQKECIEALNSLQNHFNSFNIDLMYGLPNQTPEDAMKDLDMALEFSPKHLSWYHLTLEPNTPFHKYPPPLPDEESLWEMLIEGHARLSKAGFNQYEISAFAKPGFQCKHNLNYWNFGDYLGVGAGAHGKITEIKGPSLQISRYAKKRVPKDYLDPNNTFLAETKLISEKERVFEFMLNALRLVNGFSLDLFEARTGLEAHTIQPKLEQAEAMGFIDIRPTKIELTTLGKQFHNNLLEIFLPA